MADKAISELVSAEQIKAADMFVLEQDGSAKKLTGQVLLNWLTAAADGHGGIQSIAKTSSSGRVDTYTITLADQTKQIFTVTNGEKGDKGDNSYVWIKYASVKPTSAATNLSDIPDDWMGIYSGNSSTAPTSYTSYKWFEIKGATGDIGDAASLEQTSIQYQSSSSGTVIPSGSWTDSIPNIQQGKYLWTRVKLRFNKGPEADVEFYSVSRIGIDGTGTGTVTSINQVYPDSNGNVELHSQDVDALSLGGGTMRGSLSVIYPTNGDHAASKDYVDDGKNLFTNTAVAASAFISDSTYADYPYRGTVALTGVTSSMIPEVTFSVADLAENEFAPVAQCYNGGVYIYSADKPTATVVIPTIICWR